VWTTALSTYVGNGAFVGLLAATLRDNQISFQPSSDNACSCLQAFHCHSCFATQQTNPVLWTLFHFNKGYPFWTASSHNIIAGPNALPKSEESGRFERYLIGYTNTAKNIPQVGHFHQFSSHEPLLTFAWVGVQDNLALLFPKEFGHPESRCTFISPNSFCGTPPHLSRSFCKAASQHWQDGEYSSILDSLPYTQFLPRRLSLLLLDHNVVAPPLGRWITEVYDLDAKLNTFQYSC
jgi:hypothetical protein